MQFHRVCKASEISDEGALYRFEVEGRPIVVTRLGENLYAADSTCTHEEADLSLGMLTGEVLTCPLHQAKFNIETGQVLSGPNGDDPETIPNLRTYVVKVEESEVYVGI